MNNFKIKYNNLELMGYPVYNDSIEKIKLSENKIIINTINPHSYVIAKSDKIFQKALLNSNILLADGVGIVFASLLLKRRKVHKINGPHLFNYLLNHYHNRNLKIFFLGSTENTLHKIKNRISKEYPNFHVEYYSPPFKKEFTKADNKKIIYAINSFEPDILFVGMTAPKQEKWVYKNEQAIITKMICSIGAVFDFYAETVKMPGKFWQKFGLIWLIRFIREPKKLWKRVFISTPKFIFYVFLSTFKISE